MDQIRNQAFNSAQVMTANRIKEANSRNQPQFGDLKSTLEIIKCEENADNITIKIKTAFKKDQLQEAKKSETEKKEEISDRNTAS